MQGGISAARLFVAVRERKPCSGSQARGGKEAVKARKTQVAHYFFASWVSRNLIRSAKSSACRAVFFALSASAVASSLSSSISFRNGCERSSLAIRGIVHLSWRLSSGRFGKPQPWHARSWSLDRTFASSAPAVCQSADKARNTENAVRRNYGPKASRIVVVSFFSRAALSLASEARLSLSYVDRLLG